MLVYSGIVRSAFIAIAATLAFAATDGAAAGPGGGHGGHGFGGFHGSGGGFHGIGSSFHGGFWRGPAHDPARGGYNGWRGYYGGGYGRWHGDWGRWGWPSIGLGWYAPVLPWGYETLWWDGVPYYYADDSYFLWDNSVGEYQAVDPPWYSPGAEPPAPVTDGSSASGGDGTVSATWTNLYAYPKGGQSKEQQTRDRDECQKWAVSQTDFNAAQPPQKDEPLESSRKRESYLRAEAACLTARNYSVK